MAAATLGDEYAAWRTPPDASRLCYQHFIWRELYKSNIHPSIKLENKPGLRIAELAAAHCIWAVQVAEEFPEAQVCASDIDLGLCPPQAGLPSNVSVRRWSIFEPVPEEWKSSFDLVHVRLVIQPFSGNQDPRPVLHKFVSMLKPGGYLQWDEYEYADANTGLTYVVSDPTKVPSPQLTHNSSTKLWQLVINTYQWPTEHFNKLASSFREASLVDVHEYRPGPPPSIFRAFFENWFAFVMLITPVLEGINKSTGREARGLLENIQREAREDGVFCTPTPKIVIGRRPL